jgi:cytochrome c oxidase subunit 4
MSEYTTEEIHHHVKTYVMVFAALAALTIVTVAISYLDLDVVPAVILALIVASIKGTLVACYFMHLISEKVTGHQCSFNTCYDQSQDHRRYHI